MNNDDLFKDLAKSLGYKIGMTVDYDPKTGILNYTYPKEENEETKIK